MYMQNHPLPIYDYTRVDQISIFELFNTAYSHCLSLIFVTSCLVQDTLREGIPLDLPIFKSSN